MHGRAGNFGSPLRRGQLCAMVLSANSTFANSTFTSSSDQQSMIRTHGTEPAFILVGAATKYVDRGPRCDAFHSDHPRPVVVRGGLLIGRRRGRRPHVSS